MLPLNQSTQEHYLAIKRTFIVVICHFFSSANEMKVIANLQQDCFEILILFSMNRHMTAGNGNREGTEKTQCAGCDFFFKQRKVNLYISRRF